MSSGFDRAAERPNYAKPFAFTTDDVAGTSNAEKMNRF